MTAALLSFLCIALFSSHLIVNGFCVLNGKKSFILGRKATENDEIDGVYSNPIIGAVSKFLPSSSLENASKSSSLIAPDKINWNVKKIRKMKLSALATSLQKSLTEREWFVTGNVDPSYFSDDFEFEDPDVKVSGIKAYAEGVYKLFDQDVSRGEIVNVVVSQERTDTLTVTWRLSGAVKILGLQLKIKPYIVFTDLTVARSTGLIESQLDRFSIPGYDIILSALFPVLSPFLSPPAAPLATLLEEQ